MSDRPKPLSLFEGYGIEIEYVLVDRATLAARPLADRVLADAVGSPASDFEDGDIGWSNELVLHVLELKTNGPTPDLAAAEASFQRSLGRLGEMLEPHGARLMPTGMHPWMDPSRETHLWPHECAEIYAAYDRLFDCRRHGWANVQATHLNLPFADDAEFGSLVAAARLVLPLLPALAASSPVFEGRVSGHLDARLVHYRTNAARVPALSGDVIPEPVYSIAAYHEQVLEPTYAALAPLDPEGILAGNEWVNARGAIARFDRNALELRLLDVQEWPGADLAICAAVTEVVRALVEERWASASRQRAWATADLVAQLSAATTAGPHAPVLDPAYAEVLGCPGAKTLRDVWATLLETTFRGPSGFAAHLDAILGHGTLAERILRALGAERDREGTVARERLAEVYGELCACLDAGRGFRTTAR